MSRYTLSHLSDQTLLTDLVALVARDRTTTAALLAHIAEVDTRKLYVQAAYPSMFAYCVGELRLSEDAAFKRIKAARAARRFPALFAAVADGRLNLSGIVLLAPHLTEDTAVQLMAVATHKSRSEIERLLAERFPQPDVLAMVEAIAPSAPAFSATQQAPGPVADAIASGPIPEQAEPVIAVTPSPVQDRARVKPLALQRYAVHFTMSQSAHDKLRYAQELLGHQIPAGDIAQLFERALDMLIPQLERARFAATANPRPGRRRENANPRYVPADVRRAVWERDQGRCTFVSEAGRRCEARSDLEFDHVQEVARGGEAAVSGIRLLCRAHNQYQAECAFGAEFMRHKRVAAAEARAAARVPAAAREQAASRAVPAAAQQPVNTAL